MFSRAILRFTHSARHVRFNSTTRNQGRPSGFTDTLFGKTAIFTGGSLLGAYLYEQDSNRKNEKQDSSADSIAPSTLPLSMLDPPKYASDSELEEAVDKIRNVVKASDSVQPVVDNLSEQRKSHSDTYFNTVHPMNQDQAPKYVVFPGLTEEVSEVLKICNEYRVPVVATSGMSSLEGHFIATRGGITIDISRMAEIVKLNKEDLDITVQAGVGWEELADYLSEHNLLFSLDPGPGATISGICATNASGTNASRYGECYKNVLSLTVVLPDGSIVKTKQRPRKSSAGYNLNSLFVGSEGTLGIITEATLRLHVKPAVESVAVVPFKTIKDAATAVGEIVRAGVELNAIEMLDTNMMKCINKSGETSRQWSENPTLFLKIGAANKDSMKSLVDHVSQITKANGSQEFQFATDDDEKTELWSARKVALWSTIDQGKEENKDAQLWTTDAAVPISNLPQFLEETVAELNQSGLDNTLVAHIGDGNAHSFIVYSREQHQLVEDLVHNMIRRALRYEGTCTGEHGVGLGKRDFLLEEIGDTPVDLMRRIKLLIDPNRIMNPDKIFRIDPNDITAEVHTK